VGSGDGKLYALHAPGYELNNSEGSLDVPAAADLEVYDEWLFIDDVKLRRENN